MTVHIEPAGRGWLKYVPFKEYVAYPQHAFFDARGRRLRTIRGYPAT